MLTLPGYTFNEQLYESAHSMIYRGRRNTDDLPVVFKMLKNEYPAPEELARFRREYEMTRSLNPSTPLRLPLRLRSGQDSGQVVDGVINVYSLKPYKNSLVIVLEDFGGESLTRLLPNRTLNLPEFLRLAIRITDILAAIHHRHIMHKDINPSNIVWNPETDRLKIIDFGISTELSREQPEIRNPNVLEGTLAYMSPEQTGRMNRAMDYRTDLYSLGATFYEMLTGRLPFQAEDAMELVHCHLAKMPVPPCEFQPTPNPSQEGNLSPLEEERFHSSVEGGQGDVIPLPGGVRGGFPKILSDIIMKLMAKTAEERYQSAHGVKADLQTCLAQLTTTGTIEPFITGQQDVSERFQIPQKLYGREQEIQTLLQAFERVANPQSTIIGQQSAIELVLVTGYAGIGKSSLVNEIHKPIVEKRGYFIAGKFDQFKRNIPYSALIQAFQTLVRQILTEPEVQIALWKEKLLKALGPNGQVIIEVIPEVELIIGKQPPVPELPPAQAQNRFNFVFRNFVRTFAAAEHPLVIFLDDLQWADSPLLNLIELIMNDPNTNFMLIIGAYRDNEVSNAHPLMLKLDDIRNTGAIVNTITLKPLDLENVNHLIADTLHVHTHPYPSQEGNSPAFSKGGPGGIFPLAELSFRKTGGNPFFLRQFLRALYEDNLLEFDVSQGVWEWKLEKIQKRGMTDNVVELMAGKIQKLPEVTQQVVKLASCIGNTFDLKTLAVVYEKSEKETAHDLWEALQEGLILVISGQLPVIKREEQLMADNCLLPAECRFLHDRVQQAAYSLIEEDYKKEGHLKIGRLMFEHTPEQDREERVFDIVNHLNIGRTLIESQSEKDKLAELNLMAGKKAKASTAYQPALNYLEIGIEMLRKNDWHRKYDLILALYVEAAEAAYLSGDFEKMELLAEMVLQQARTLLDKVKVYEVKIEACISQNKLLEAVKTALSVLKLLGVKFPEKPGKLHILLDLARTKFALAGKPIDTLSDLPEMTDPDTLAAMHILSRVTSAAYLAVPALFPLMVFRQVRLSIKYGNASMSAFVYAAYGLILCGVLGNIDSGYQFGQLALRLLEKFNANEIKARTLFVVSDFIKHWKDHTREGLHSLLEAYQSGLDTGDVEYATYAAFVHSYHSYTVGRELSELGQEMAAYSRSISQLKQKNTLHYNEIFRQAALNLMGNADDSQDSSACRLIGEAFNEDTALPLLLEANDRTAIYYVYLNKIILCYLFQDYTQALENVAMVKKYPGGGRGGVGIAIFYFYDSLARLALYPSVPNSQQKSFLKEVAANQKKMKKWARQAPLNRLHKWYLVEAERARVLGNKTKAMEYYDKAIALAREHEYLNEEALAYELTARFWLEKNNEEIAQLYMKKAHHAYQRWGAARKVQDLEEKYPQLLVRDRKDNGILRKLAHPSTSTDTTGANSEVLDLSTVIKASQAISGEIVLEKLLTTMMQIVIENAGAQKGLLLLEKNGTWCIEAACGVDCTEKHVLQSIPVMGRVEGLLQTSKVLATSEVSPLPVSLINYVARTQESVVLHDAEQEGMFTRDPYITTQQPKSILCLPLLNQGKLTGILYLENNLMKGSFTPDRLEVLNLLSSQMAVSIENARLYTDLRQSERKYRRLFEDSKDVIFITTPDGQFVDINQAGLDLFGFSQDELTTINVIELYVNPDDRIRFQRILAQDGSVRDFEVTLRKKDGAAIDCLLTATVRRANDGGIIAYQGILRDITAHKRAEAERLRFTRQLAELNKAYERFVPAEFLSFLKKESIVEVHLGDQVEQEMTVLFSDIRDFTTLSESMSPQENFNFINSYLSRMEPVIIEHQGFIDKYIGDAIMALFAGSADDAVNAGIAMLHKLSKYNRDRHKTGYQPIRIGIGINTGSLMLGTVGGRNRMESTVISDAVNLAARIEDMTKTYGVGLLISAYTYLRLQDNTRYNIRIIDRVKVKGKSEPVAVLEVIDGDPPHVVELKIKSAEDFENGMYLYRRKEFLDAREFFNRVLQVNPGDNVAQVYLKRCKHFQKHGVPEEWEGIETLGNN